MAYLNESEREALLQDLSRMNFNKARGRLRRMDPQGRLAVYRNVQNTGEWVTRYDLVGLGTRVTLIEDCQERKTDGRVVVRPEFELVRVVVEPMPGNRT
jgi:hypothetical protein